MKLPPVKLFLTCAGIAIAMLLALHIPAVAGEDAYLSPTRYRAALVGLLGEMQDSSAPTSANDMTREQLRQQCLSLIREGGYQHNAALQSLGVETSTMAQVGKTLRQLQALTPVRHPGDDKALLASAPHTPGALLLAVPVALAYARAPAHGLRAAEHLARAASDDPQAPLCARITARIVQLCLAGLGDRTEIVRRAAEVVDDEDLATAVRAAKQQDWDKLEPESKPLGQLQRVLQIWIHNTDFSAALQKGREKLKTQEAQRLLAVLCGTTSGLSGEPADVVRKTLADPQTGEVMNDLYALAEDGVLLPVRDIETTAPQQAQTRKVSGSPPGQNDPLRQIKEPTPPYLSQSTGLAKDERARLMPRIPSPATRTIRTGRGSAHQQTGKASGKGFPDFPKFPNFPK